MLYFFSLQVRGWRVLLASHLPAIQRELASTFWGFPSFATTLDGLTKKVDMVQQWVEVAYSASLVLPQADQSMQLFPPTVLRWLCQKCTHALTPIESGLTTDEELQAMRADLNTARTYLMCTVARVQNADLDKEITDREARLQPVMNALAWSTRCKPPSLPRHHSHQSIIASETRTPSK